MQLNQDARKVQSLARTNNQLIFEQDEKLSQLNGKNDQALNNLRLSNQDLHERSISHQSSKKCQAFVLVAVLVTIALGAVAYFTLA